MRVCISMLLILFVSSCRSFVYYEKGKFTMYRQFETAVRDLRVDGVYLTVEHLQFPNDTADTWIEPLLFYKDGTAYKSSYILVPAGESIDSSLAMAFSFIKPDDDDWAAFYIDRDKTISLQNFYGFGKPRYHNVYEEKGRLLSDTSFLFDRDIHKGDETMYKYSRVYHFYPLRSKPDSTNWLMKDRRLNKLAKKRKEAAIKK